ncbi:MAG: hypothetical protein GDA47_02610, partial [Rhodospirillales bacterium]|nr:hypothetical protein [Rhodospirillales bacterium]
MNDWILDLPETLDQVWVELDNAARDRQSPFRYLAVATVTGDRSEIR